MAAKNMAERVHRRNSGGGEAPSITYESIDAHSDEDIAKELAKPAFGTLAVKKGYLKALLTNRAANEQKLNALGGAEG
jgi:hypothetical protein